MDFHINKIEIPTKAKIAFRYLKKHGHLQDVDNEIKLKIYARWKYNGFCGNVSAFEYHAWRTRHEFETAVIDCAFDADVELTDNQFIEALTMTPIMP